MYIDNKGLAGHGQLVTVTLPSSDTSCSTLRPGLKAAPPFEEVMADSCGSVSDDSKLYDACSSGDESVSSLHTGDIGYNEEGNPTYLLS